MKHSGRRRVRRPSMRCAVFFAAVLTAGALAHTAQASTLAGEAFAASETAGDVVEAACGATFTDPFTYHVEGRAGPPHPGTFTEDGTVVVNEFGEIVSLDATFAISSLAGDVTGEKHFLGPPSSPDTAVCLLLGDPPSGFANIFGHRLCYRAVFADGSQETGVSILRLHDNAGGTGFFGETFTPDPTVSCEPTACPPGDDDDGDGLTNNNESLFFTLLDNSDSDLDGIADGNDDANGNGEDDEDEDDDEDDDCPDEDSDGDGDDDEDEDDDED